jgi:hypothetical protein
MLIPFEMDTAPWAVIASLDLPEEDIRDEARHAFDSGEIDEVDYNRIISRLESRMANTNLDIQTN